MIEDAFLDLWDNKKILSGAVIILVLTVIALFASLIAPHDPVDQNLKMRLLLPNTEYPLGTDQLGRCIMSRLIYATGISLSSAVAVVGITFVIGVTVGVICGYFGGMIDDIMMRVVDIFLAFPGLILALAIIAALGPGLFNALLALVVVGWSSYSRVVRGCVLSIKEEDYIEGIKALGADDVYIMVRYILPNIIAPVIPIAMFGVGYVILAMAGLSFLGLGVQPPTPEWGSMLNAGREYIRTAPHIMISPGLAIMVTVLAFNLLGDGLRDRLDSKREVIE